MKIQIICSLRIFKEMGTTYMMIHTRDQVSRSKKRLISSNLRYELINQFDCLCLSRASLIAFTIYFLCILFVKGYTLKSVQSSSSSHISIIFTFTLLLSIWIMSSTSKSQPILRLPLTVIREASPLVTLADSHCNNPCYMIFSN